MQKFKSENKEQIFLLPPSIEEFINDQHLAKLVSEVVDSLDTRVIENKYSLLGQKSYSHKLLLKLLFYGYAIGIRSGRKIASACQSDLAFMYLSCMYHPDFRTINDFRKNNIEVVEQFFVEVLKICSSLGLVNMGTMVIDSTKLCANASSRRTKTKEQYEKWVNALEQQTKQIMQQAEEADAEEDKQFGDDKSGDELPVNINMKERLKNKIKEVMQEMTDEEKVNLTDNDAKTILNKGVLKASYNCQTGVTDNGIIVAAYASNNASDKEQLQPVIELAEKNTAQTCTTILADSGYTSYDNYELLTGQNKVILIPDQQKELERQKSERNKYHRNHFKYDVKKDQFICPEGKTLSYRGSFKSTKNKQQGKRYKGDECHACSYLQQCSKGSSREIQIENREPLRMKIRNLLDSPFGKKVYNTRKHIIEPIFGNMKHNLKYTIVHLRGLEKVTSEWQLICLTHNIKQIWKAKRA